jgi:hypothetical protein
MTAAGFGYMRNSFHRVPGVRPIQAERRFVAFASYWWVGMALSADWMRPKRWLQYKQIANAQCLALMWAFGNMRVPTLVEF